MTDPERARWREVQEAYKAALAIAVAAWPKDTPADVLQASAATVLIEFGKHRPVPPAVESLGKTPLDAPAHDAVAALVGGLVPTACPVCHGELYDNRSDKAAGRLPAKRPDFKCKSCDWAQWPPRRPATSTRSAR